VRAIAAAVIRLKVLGTPAGGVAAYIWSWVRDDTAGGCEEEEEEEEGRSGCSSGGGGGGE
jgi:hypothetical protein